MKSPTFALFGVGVNGAAAQSAVGSKGRLSASAEKPTSEPPTGGPSFAPPSSATSSSIASIRAVAASVSDDLDLARDLEAVGQVAAHPQARVADGRRRVVERDADLVLEGGVEPLLGEVVEVAPASLARSRRSAIGGRTRRCSRWRRRRARRRARCRGARLRPPRADPRVAASSSRGRPGSRRRPRPRWRCRPRRARARRPGPARSPRRPRARAVANCSRSMKNEARPSSRAFEALGELVAGAQAVALRGVDRRFEVVGRREHHMAVEDAEAVLVVRRREVGHALVLVLLVGNGVLGERISIDSRAWSSSVVSTAATNLVVSSVSLRDAEAGLLAQPRLDVLRVGEVDAGRRRPATRAARSMKFAWIRDRRPRAGARRARRGTRRGSPPARPRDGSSPRCRGACRPGSRSRARRPSRSPRRRSRRGRGQGRQSRRGEASSYGDYGPGRFVGYSTVTVLARFRG